MDCKEDSREASGGLDLQLGLTAYEPGMMDSKKKKRRVYLLDMSVPHGRDVGSSLEAMQEDDLKCSKHCTGKKLRLSQNQITLLEASFEQQSTLTMFEKQVLAEKLSLQPRQVEVWFQNRRARSKVKQTEIDCELLKKNCERLIDENLQLRKQVMELRLMAKTENLPLPPKPFLCQPPKAPLPVLKTYPHVIKYGAVRAKLPLNMETDVIHELDEVD